MKWLLVLLSVQSLLASPEPKDPQDAVRLFVSNESRTGILSNYTFFKGRCQAVPDGQETLPGLSHKTRE